MTSIPNTTTGGGEKVQAQPPAVIHVADQTGSPRTYRVLSLSRPGLYRYTDLDANDGAGICTCPHHTFTGAFCKHLKLATEVAAHSALVAALRMCEDRVLREKREAGGFRSGVSSEASTAAAAAREALSAFVAARMVWGRYVPGMPPRKPEKDRTKTGEVAA